MTEARFAKFLDEPEIPDQYISPRNLTRYAELIRALDPYHPVVVTTWQQAFDACIRAGIPVGVTALRDTAKDIRTADVGAMAVVIGSEGQGVRQEILDKAANALIIPMNPHCESLNAAVAATAVMWQMGKF